MVALLLPYCFATILLAKSHVILKKRKSSATQRIDRHKFRLLIAQQSTTFVYR